ncbi:MAG: hypothetical protein ABIJ47_15790 [Candidatus Bathyarchaeota archaeon]
MNRSTPIAILLVTVIIVSVAWRYTHPPQYSEEGFSIILTKDGSRVLSDADIQRYNTASHELTLTEECADRMKRMREPLMGDFVIIVDGEEDLRGVFVPPVVSRSYPSTEVVILYPSFDSDYRTMKIQMGYPWDQPTEVDPRRNSKMIQHFDKTGRLTR